MISSADLLALARAVQTGGTLVVLGTLVATIMGTGGSAACQRRVLWAGVVAAWIAAPAWLVLQAGEMAGTTALGDALRVAPLALYGSGFGRALLLRLVLLLAAGWLGTGRWRGARWLALLAAIPAGLLQVRMGHAAAPEEAWQPVAAGLHVLAAGVWIGGLPSLLGALDIDARRAARRFSAIGMIAVLAIAATALVQARDLVGGLPGLLGTAYGHAVLLKCGLFAVLLGFAALNRCVLTPLLVRPGGVVGLRWSVRIEASIGIAAVVAAAWLAAQAPGAHERPVWPLPWQPSPDAFDDTRAAGLWRSLCWLAAGGVLAIVAACWPGLAKWRGLAGMAAGAGIVGWAMPGLRVLLVPAYPTSFYESPTGFTPASVAAGAALYPSHCAACHGARGFGDGPRAGALPRRPLPLTGFHLLQRSDGEMFWLLSSGMRDGEGRAVMPGFADRLSEDQLWALIDYVRTLAGAEPGDNAPPQHHHH